MAENSGADKSEQATPRRREKALEEGQVAKSMELNSAIVLLAALLGFSMMSGYFTDTLFGFVKYTYMQSSFIDISVYSFPGQVAFATQTIFKLVGPIILLIMIGGLVSNIGQVGFVISKKAIMPKFDKISPINGIKKMFSLRSTVEALKGVLKILIVSIVAYNVVSNHIDEYIHLATRSVNDIIAFAITVIFELGLKVRMALFVMAVADFAYQKYEHEKGLKMTKQEVKDEVKQQEGDSKIKGKIRSKQLEMSAQRMMMNVPDASVVITNPIFIAIALKYDPESNSDAPKVIAKGKRKIAAKIKEIAMENDIPVIENKPLARSMYDACQIGMEIPYDFFQAVAEILADIINSKNKKRIAI